LANVLIKFELEIMLFDIIATMSNLSLGLMSELNLGLCSFSK